MANKTFANTPGGATISSTNPGYEEGQVGIPGVNVSTINSPANPTGEMGTGIIPGVNDISGTNGTNPANGGTQSSSSTVTTDTTTGVNTNLGKAIEEGIDENKKLEETINTNFEQGQKDIVSDKETDTKIATDFYNENEKLIKEANDELAKIEEEQLKLAEERKGRDVALLEGKKQSEIDMLEASNALQRAKNEQTLKEARYKIEIEKQQSAWAYNKLGLGFSSGIINQSQQIATQGIAKIAEIKAQMAFNEASIDAQIAGLEFDYSSLVNETIDKYADRTNEIKESMKNRINETKKSLLLNSFDKNKELTTIEREARDALKDAERQHIEDIIKVKDRGIQMEEMLQSEISRYKNEELAKMDTMLSNGTFAKLTPDQVALKEQELGLPAGSLTAEFNSSIGADIRGTFDSILGADYMVDNMPTLVQDMKNEMKMGRTYEEAFNVIMSRELKDNKTYQAEKAKVSLEERKFQLEQEKEAFNQRLKEAQFGLDEKYKLGSLNLAKSKASAGSGSGSGVTSNSDYGNYVATYGEGSNALTEKEWNSMSAEQKNSHLEKVGFEKTKKGLVNGDINIFNSTYENEISNMITAVNSGKERDMKTAITSIISELQSIGAKENTIRGYLESAQIIDGNKIKYKDGKIIETTGLNSTIYNFNKK